MAELWQFSFFSRWRPAMLRSTVLHCDMNQKSLKPEKFRKQTYGAKNIWSRLSVRLSVARWH